jgi:hypothetical protein
MIRRENASRIERRLDLLHHEMGHLAVDLAGELDEPRFGARLLRLPRRAFGYRKRLVNRRLGWSWMCGMGGLPMLGQGRSWASSCGEAIH